MKYQIAIIFVFILFIGGLTYSLSPNSAPFFPTFLSLIDTPDSYVGQAGKVATVNGTETGLTFLDANGGGGGLADTNKVKVSANDSTPGYLEDKVTGGMNTQTITLNDGGNEKVQINVDLNGLGGGGGPGRTYTSGSPATIQVNNDLNTISQNYDGNFWARFTPANDGNFYVKFQQNYDGNFWARFTPANDGNFYVKFQQNYDSNFWVRFTPAYDGNFWLRFTPAYDGNFWSRFTPANDGNFYTRFKPNFDSNFNQSFDSNFWSRFTPSYDSNFWFRFTPANDGNFWARFKQNFDSNFATRMPLDDVNVSTLSWVKLLNYPTGCGAFLAVQTIGDTLGCISVPSEANIDGNFYANLGALVPWQDVNVSDDLRINTLKDANIGDLNVTNDINAHGSIIIDINLLIKNDTNAARDLSIGRDLNVERNTQVDKNLYIPNGGQIVFNTGNGNYCMFGNNFDNNGGFAFRAC